MHRFHSSRLNLVYSHTYPTIRLTRDCLGHLKHHKRITINLFLVKVFECELLYVPLESAFVFVTLKKCTLKPSMVFLREVLVYLGVDRLFVFAPFSGSGYLYDP